MIGLILIGHAHIASEMLKGMEHVVGHQPLTEAFDVPSNADAERLRKELADAIRRLDAGSGVLLIADMFGGTPCNIALSMLRPGSVEVLSGMNLPMLVKVGSLRKECNDVHKLASAGRDSGKSHIHLASELLAKGKEDA